MTVYPNPADENFNVMIQLESDMNASLTVTNALGQIILHKNDHFSAGSTVSIMNSSNWVRGIYFVEFKDSETSNKIVKKIVIQ